ncbi:MAG: hypothetical protein MUP97_05205 [Acidimicrobiia bacterium]|jgi:hypothetical protein|nr:hypothetical protein [Acidimicrobiia bacterium]
MPNLSTTSVRRTFRTLCVALALGIVSLAVSAGAGNMRVDDQLARGPASG